jgi:hemoglobin
MNPDRLIAERRARLAPGTGVGVTEDMIYAVVHAFYGRIRADAILGPIFEQAIAPEAWPAHLAKMCDFWSSVLLMTGRFHGSPMAVHVGIPDLSPPHFAQWLRLFRLTTAELCPPAAAELFLAKAEMIAQSLQLGISASRGELLPDLTQSEAER